MSCHQWEKDALNVSSRVPHTTNIYMMIYNENVKNEFFNSPLPSRGHLEVSSIFHLEISSEERCDLISSEKSLHQNSRGTAWIPSEIELRSTSLPASFTRNPSKRVVKSEERKQTEQRKGVKRISWAPRRRREINWKMLERAWKINFWWGRRSLVLSLSIFRKKNEVSHVVDSTYRQLLNVWFMVFSLRCFPVSFPLLIA